MDIQSITEDYIRIAQDNFGPMCSEWKYNGIEFQDNGPHLGYYPDTGHVVISLSNKAKDDEEQLHFQLAHEVCHLLYPTMSLDGKHEKPTVMNEGISTYFSVWAAGRFSSQEYIINNLREHNQKYHFAMSKVQELLEKDQDCIKNLRLIEPKLNKLTKSDFKKLNILVPEELIDDLLSVF